LFEIDFILKISAALQGLAELLDTVETDKKLVKIDKDKIWR
jgi:hypothetical protein